MGWLAVVLASAFGCSGLADARGVAVYRAEAKADAARQLSQLSLPAGTQRVSGDPSASSSLGRRPNYHVGGVGARYVAQRPYVVDDHRFSRMSEDPASVASWVRAHPPRGSVGKWFRRSDGASLYTIGFGFPGDPGRVVQRALVIQVTAARAGGSAIRADAMAEWLPVRPGWDQVPKRARVLTATLVIDRAGKPRTSRTATFTTLATVRPIVHVIDHARAVAPVIPPPCAPKLTYETVHFSFRARRDGPVLASGSAGFYCIPRLRLEVGGRRGPTLLTPPRLWQLVRQIQHRNHQRHS